MLSLTPKAVSQAFISGVKYLSEKRQILLEFDGEKKFTERHTFFPKFFVSVKGSNSEALRETLSLYNPKKFQLEFNNEIAQVTAATFSDLKKMANLLESALRLSPCVLGPERQFLVENNLSYFNCFQVEGNEKEKMLFPVLPDIKLDFLSDSLSKTLESLMSVDLEGAEKLVDCLIFSKILSLPPQEVPLKKSLQAELFLEKIFFKHGFDFQKKKERQTQKEKKSLFKPFMDIAELDFSFVWPTLFTFPYYNIGFDSLDCGCCQPQSLTANNISPASLIEVEFQSEGFYIMESNDLDFSQEFHESMPGQQSRKSMQKEWHLNTVPIGPFQKNQKALIPLADFKKIDSNQIKPSGRSQWHWFCQKKESFLSQEINALNHEITLLGKKLEELEKKALKQFKLNSTKALNESREYFFIKRNKEKIAELLAFIPRHLFSSRSRFYSKEIARTIKVIQAQTLHEFKEFAFSQGEKMVQSANMKAFVKSDSPLALARQFSLKQRLPLPLLRKKHAFKSIPVS